MIHEKDKTPKKKKKKNIRYTGRKYRKQENLTFPYGRTVDPPNHGDNDATLLAAGFDLKTSFRK